MTHGHLELNTSQTIQPIPLVLATLSQPTPPPSLPPGSHLKEGYPSTKRETQTLKNELSKRKWEFISTLPPTAPHRVYHQMCLFQSQPLDTHTTRAGSECVSVSVSMCAGV